MDNLMKSTKKVIHVLHVVHSMNCGGAENMIMNLYRQIDRSQIQFDFLVHSTEKAFFDDEIREKGGKIYYAPYYQIINESLYRKKLNELFNQHPEFAIVHGHLGSCAHVYLDVAKRQGRYTIAHSHNTKPQLSLKNLIYRFFTFKTRRIADFFMGCGKEAGEFRFGMEITSDKSKYCILNNAINTDVFKPNPAERSEIRDEFGIKNEEYLLGHIGRFNYQKNHAFLLDIFKAVSDIHENAKLILIGDGILKDQIQEKTVQLGLQDKVIFAGLRSDVPQLLKGIDCFVFPSHYEGLPVTVIEAQAAGLPCVISDRITREVGITSLVEYVSLDVTPEVWRDAIIQNQGVSRDDTSQAIIEAGYDIHTTVQWLTHFYKNKAAIAGGEGK